MKSKFMTFLKKNKQKLLSYALVIVAYVVVQTSINNGSISFTMKSLLVPTCAYITAALALNLLVGYLGDLCLGQAGFMAVGAFAGSVCFNILNNSIASVYLCLAISILVGGLCAAFFGLIVGVPVLKLNGDYLAIVTLAFCQIIKTLLINLYVGFDSKGLHIAFMENTMQLEADGIMVVKGALGIANTKTPANFTFGVILVLVTLFIIYNLINSKTGRAIQACRDNKIAALSVGISTTKYKLIAFVLSAAIAGMAGTLYGLGFSSIKATKFDFNLSILILVYVVLGGLGNMTGTMISTTILLVLPEALRAFNDYRMIIYSVVLIVVMLVTNNKRLMTYFESYKQKVFGLFKKGGN